MAAQDQPTSGGGGGNVKPPSGPTPEETQTATAAAAALASANLALLHKETERVAKKQKVSVAKSAEAVDGLLDEVRRARSRLAETSEADGDRRAVLDDLFASLNTANYASQVRYMKKQNTRGGRATLSSHWLDVVVLLIYFLGLTWLS